MNKYDKYVYLTICEASIELFNHTNYVTYTSFCKSIAKSIDTNTLNAREKAQTNSIFKIVELLFGMSVEETSKYIVEYFHLEDSLIRQFEKSVRLTKELFPDINR